MPGRARCVATWIAVVVAVSVTTGCPDSSQSGRRVDGGAIYLDGQTGGLNDSDGDGLCDDTEVSRALDPSDPDTDADGYSDWVEVVFGFDGLAPASPDRAEVISLKETPESSTQVTHLFRVRGSGQDFTGAFEALPARSEDVTAGDFYQGSVALYANPPDNAAVVEEEAQRFRGVVGETELAFETRLSFGDATIRRCSKAYPFRYGLKRSDGRLVGVDRLLLVVVPEGDTLETAEWCVPSPPCM